MHQKGKKYLPIGKFEAKVHGHELYSSTKFTQLN